MNNRRFLLASIGLGVLSLMVNACTVQPLYAPSANTTRSQLAGMVEIEPPSTRLEQDVRETMLFRIGGGDATASSSSSSSFSPSYRVKLSVTGRPTGIFKVRNADGINRTSAGQYTVTADMIIYDAETGAIISTDRRSSFAEFNKTRQEFATERATLDASKRAARELGEMLYTVLASRIARNS